MIIYDTKKWRDSMWKIFLSLNRGNNYKILLRSVLLVVVYSTIFTYLSINYFNIKFRLDPFFFSLLGLILSLFLVFRLNSSYNKWWEGRQLWGSLINHSRTLAAYMSAVLEREDKDVRRQFALQISNFAYALKGHLRSDMQFHNFDPDDDQYFDSIKDCPNIPHKMASSLFRSMEKLYKEDKISDMDKINIKIEIKAMIDILGACERIRNTPIPFSHSSFFKSFIIIYIASLPFGFVNTFLYFTIPATLLISYALLGIEIISEEIEEPFGKDPNDLPITHLSGIIRRDAYSILEVENTMPEITDATEGQEHYKIVH